MLVRAKIQRINTGFHACMDVQLVCGLSPLAFSQITSSLFLKSPTWSSNQFEVVRSAKLQDVIITSDLSWNEHINETVKKAAKRLYFLVQIKRAKLPCRDLVLFYATCIRSILVYAAPVFFYALPNYLQCELERVQKGAFTIICPSLSYDKALNEAGIRTIISYCEDICDRFLTLPLATRITNLTSY